MDDPASASPTLAVLLLLDLGVILGAFVWLFRRRRRLLGRVLGLTDSPLPIAPWRGSELFLAAACVLCGAVVGQQVAALALAPWSAGAERDGEHLPQIAAGAGFQLGLLGGLFLARALLRATRIAPAADQAAAPVPPPPSPARLAGVSVLRGGFATFAVALATVVPVSILWQGALRALGIEAPPQDLLSLFRDAGNVSAFTVMLLLAVVVAPVTEELIFRAGMFRWLRTRTLRGIALLLPAFLFSLIHGNLAVLLPLLALAVVLALSYEHYGHVGVPMLAHALFNVNTIALVLAGFPS